MLTRRPPSLPGAGVPRRPRRRALAGAVLASGLGLALAVSGDRAGAAPAADSCNWLGDELPLPLPVETPRDIAFKTETERQYLIFNLMAGGKLAWQRGDYAVAVQKWETLLATPGLDPQTEAAVLPFLTDAREKLGLAPGRSSPSPGAPAVPGTGVGARPHGAEERAQAIEERNAIVLGAQAMETVNGMITGGGQVGPGGAVVWLRRLDGPMPRLVPVKTSITQRDKTFIPHVLAVPVGSLVEFRNDDHIYHNVFSLAKPNDFDAGIRPSGASFTRRFERAGVVELLCNIHSSMSAYIYVVDSPYYARARSSGAFSIPNVPPGRYEIFAWHEASSAIAHERIAVVAGGTPRVALTVAGDKRPGPFVPDKYGHKRQDHLGY